MKELTDEIVAKILGWKKKHIKEWGDFWVQPDGKTFRFSWPPAFTTSLEVIVEEVKRRKLYYTISRNPHNNPRGTLADAEVDNHNTYAWAETESLALCQALLNYLKEKKK